MKTKIFIIFILFPIIQSCQQQFLFDIDYKTKFLYNEIENVFYVKNVDLNKVTISCVNAEYKIKNDTTLIINSESGATAEIKLKYRNMVKNIMFYKKDFPNPELIFSGKKYNSSKPMPLDETRFVRSVSTTIREFEYPVSFEIISMDLNIIKYNGETVFFKIIGSDVRNAFQNANKGDTYIFSNIEMELNNGKKIKGKETLIKII